MNLKRFIIVRTSFFQYLFLSSNNHILEDCARTGQPGQNTTSHCGAISREVVWKLPTTWFPRAIVWIRCNPLVRTKTKKEICCLSLAQLRTSAISKPGFLSLFAPNSLSHWSLKTKKSIGRFELPPVPPNQELTFHAALWLVVRRDDCVKAGKTARNGVSTFSIWIKFFRGQPCVFSSNSFTLECWSRKINSIMQNCHNL